jgi:hypothetical protein
VPRQARVDTPGTLHHVKELGLSLAGPARLMGVSMSAISGILQEKNPKNMG